MDILDDFVQFDEKGLYCKYGDFYIDPTTPAKRAVISHAHADHAVSGNEEIYATKSTVQFMQLRYARYTAKVINTIEYNQPFELGGVTITFIPAGHILGSAQILMQYKGVKYLYTGDYKLQPDATCEPIQFVKADVLITESTFANPEVIHPDPVVEIQKLNGIKNNIMLGAYGLGKSQRLIQMINKYAPQKAILVHHKVMPMNAIYEKAGYALGKHQLYSRKMMKTQNECVYIVPPFTFDSYIRAKDVTRLFASGWKNLQVNFNDTLFISDHVDWNDILKTVGEVEPTEIWTLHGDGKHLVTHYKGKFRVKVLN